jgi:hypothetical protein
MVNRPETTAFPALYERDFVQWTEREAGRLRQLAAEGLDVGLDLLNIAEEIESLGRSDRRELASHIRTILEHLMKLATSPALDPRASWLETIDRHRVAIEALIKDSPSLKPLIERIIVEETPTAKRLVERNLALHGETPSLPIASLNYNQEQVLKVDYSK